MSLAPADNWISITSSWSGEHLNAAAYDSFMYSSHDYGYTWTIDSQKGLWKSVTSDERYLFYIVKINV